MRPGRSKIVTFGRARGCSFRAAGPAYRDQLRHPGSGEAAIRAFFRDFWRNYGTAIRITPKRQTELAELKKYLPGPGRGTCIEDGTLCRMARPGQKYPRDSAYSGRKKAYMSNTLVRFNARGETISMTPTVRGTVNDVTLAKAYGLSLGIATDKIHDPNAPMSDRVHRRQDSGFRGTEKGEPGAVYERTVGYKALQKLDKDAKARNREIAVQRLPAEWFFGRVKRYARIRGPYQGTYSEFNDELNVAGGLVNLHLMAGGARKGPAT